MSSRRGPRFRHGERFAHELAFPEGVLRLVGTVGVDREGRLLLLWDVDIRPTAGGQLAIGPANVRRLFATVCALAVADGFDTLVVNGYRISGANPRRFAEVEFDCRSARMGPRPVETP
ncbi:MAG: hypothetical protein M3Q10_09950 [Chloroflexota bacterium]|nr:hypothetical protein [Chloroflexota bacterium]